jgi:hypothetical protein
MFKRAWKWFLRNSKGGFAVASARALHISPPVCDTGLSRLSRLVRKSVRLVKCRRCPIFRRRYSILIFDAVGLGIAMTTLPTVVCGSSAACDFRKKSGLLAYLVSPVILPECCGCHSPSSLVRQ